MWDFAISFYFLGQYFQLIFYSYLYFIFVLGSKVSFTINFLLTSPIYYLHLIWDIYIYIYIYILHTNRLDSFHWVVRYFGIVHCELKCKNTSLCLLPLCVYILDGKNLICLCEGGNYLVENRIYYFNVQYLFY